MMAYYGCVILSSNLMDIKIWGEKLPHLDSESKLSSVESQSGDKIHLDIPPPTTNPPTQLLDLFFHCCSMSPPKIFRSLCGVHTQVRTSDQMPQMGMCGVPPPNSQTSYQFGCQSSSTCISECGTPSWACFCILCNKNGVKGLYGQKSQQHWI